MTGSLHTHCAVKSTSTLRKTTGPDWQKNKLTLEPARPVDPTQHWTAPGATLMERFSAMSPHSTLSTSTIAVSSVYPGFASPPSMSMSMPMPGLALGLPPPPLLSPSSSSSSSAGKRRPYTRHSIPAVAMPEYRHVRSGSLNIPNGAASTSSSTMMPRSPPSTLAPRLLQPKLRAKLRALSSNCLLHCIPESRPHHLTTSARVESACPVHLT